jgi:hypothetical protein
MEQRLRDIEFWLKFVAVAVAVFGVWQYFEERKAAALMAAQAESLRIIRGYSSENILAARETLTQFWRDQPAFVSYASGEKAISPNEHSNFVRRTLPRYAKADDMHNALFLASDYFDNVYHCRTSGLCDEKLLDQFLCSKAEAFLHEYQPFFQAFEGTLGAQEFGRSLAEYVESCGPHRMPELENRAG